MFSVDNFLEGAGHVHAISNLWYKLTTDAFYFKIAFVRKMEQPQVMALDLFNGLCLVADLGKRPFYLEVIKSFGHATAISYDKQGLDSLL